MMAATARREPTSSTDCCDEEGQLGAVERWGTFSDVLGMDELPKDPSSCTFWCAVALGALAKGSSVESVRGDMFALVALHSWNMLVANKSVVVFRMFELSLIEGKSDTFFLARANISIVLLKVGILPTGKRSFGGKPSHSRRACKVSITQKQPFGTSQADRRSFILGSSRSQCTAGLLGGGSNLDDLIGMRGFASMDLILLLNACPIFAQPGHQGL